MLSINILQITPNADKSPAGAAHAQLAHFDKREDGPLLEFVVTIRKDVAPSPQIYRQ